MNLIKLIDKILINEQSFDKIKDYARSKNIRVPESSSLNIEYFNTFKKFKEENDNNLEEPWFGEPELSNQDVQNKFLSAEESIFLTSQRNEPLYSSYIFKYHIYTNSADKDSVMSILQNCLISILKAYDFIGREPRYFDSDYNIKTNELTVGLVNRIEARIQEVEELAAIAMFSEDEHRVYRILKKHNLVP